MGVLLRLDSLSVSLAESFRKADDEQRRHATLATCLAAVAGTDLQGNEIEAAVDFLRHGKGDPIVVRRKLVSLAEHLDEQYFKLSERPDGTTPETLRMFRKARAAAALAFALSLDPDQLHEAMYEAIIATDDPPEAMRAAGVALMSPGH